MASSTVPPRWAETVRLRLIGPAVERGDATLFRRAFVSKPVGAKSSALVLLSSDAHEAAIYVASEDGGLRPSQGVCHGVVPLANPVLDAEWCPFLSDEADACFIVTCRSQPLQLFDMQDGALRGSYKAFNKMDEITHAQSVCWSRSHHSDVIAGYGHKDDSNVQLRIFDVACEGGCKGTHESRVVRGIVSAVTEWRPFVVAWGSLHGGIELVDYRRSGATVAALWGHTSGVTQLMTSDPSYHPFNEHYIFSGARKGDDNVLLWDTRNVSNPVQRYPRSLYSHQPAAFSVVCTHDSDMLLVTSCHQTGLRIFRRDGVEVAIAGDDPLRWQDRGSVGVTSVGASQVLLLRGSMNFALRDRYAERAGAAPCLKSKRPRQPGLAECSDVDDDEVAEPGPSPSSAELLYLARERHSN
jgi:hypothetical protein